MFSLQPADRVQHSFTTYPSCKHLCPASREHLARAEEKAIEDQESAKQRFRDWVKTKVPDAEYMNICSGAQVTRQPTMDILIASD